MARSHGVFKTSAWAPGSDFRALTPLAQWAYWMLLSQPQISNLGVLAYTPEKWARLAGGLTVDTVESAIDELAEGRYVILDRDVGELLVRTFVKHDNVWRQWQLVANARRLIQEVESDEIRGYLIGRHPWLVEQTWFAQAPAFDDGKARRAWDQGAIEAYENTPLDSPPDTPLSEPTNQERDTPVERGVETPVMKKRDSTGAGEGEGVGGSAAGLEQKTTTPRPAAHANGNGQPAAADPSTEAPRESHIADAVAQLRGADPDTQKHVQPLARQIPAVLFDDVLDRVNQRDRTGHVTNPPGLLVELLRLAVKQQRVRERPAIASLTHRERIELEARSYAHAGHDWHIVEPLLRNNLRRHEAPAAQTEELIDAAGDAYRSAERAPEGATT